MMRANKTRARIKNLAASTALILLLWQLGVWVSGVPAFILPPPYDVFVAFVEHAALIGLHARATAIEVFVGIVLGALLGAATALYLIWSPAARRLLAPILVLSQTLPVFALAPILTLWLGYGMASKIAMALLIIYFPVASTFFDGLQNTPPGYLDLAHNLRATRARVLFYLRVPAALPSLASGLRLAAVYAPIGAVIGEWVGASQGLGYLMLLANGRVKIDLMFAALFALCVFTVLLRAAVGVLCNQIVRYAGEIREA